MLWSVKQLAAAGSSLVSHLAGLLDPITRNWAIVVSGNVARLALGFVASVLIARALGPADLGVCAVLIATAGIAGALADFGLTDSAVKHIATAWPDDPTTARLRGQVFFWLRVGAAGLVIAICVLLFTPLFHDLLGLVDKDLLVSVALLGIMVTAMNGAVNAILQALGHFGRLTIVTFLNAGLTTLAVVAFALAGQLTPFAVLGVVGAGTPAAAFVLACRLLPSTWRLHFPTYQELYTEGQRLIRFGRWLGVANMFAALATQLDLLILNRWDTAATVGIYALALNLATKVDVVNQSMYTVLLPTASTLNSPTATRSYMRRALLRSTLINLALLALLPLAQPFITFFYGPAYEPAIGLFQSLLGVAIFDVFTIPLLLLTYAFNMPKLVAAADALRAATLLLVAIWLVPSYGPVGIVIARFGARVAGAVFTLAMLWWLKGRRRGSRRSASASPSEHES